MSLTRSFAIYFTHDGLHSCALGYDLRVVVVCIDALRVRSHHPMLDVPQGLAVDNRFKKSQFKASIAGVIMLSRVRGRTNHQRKFYSAKIMEHASAIPRISFHYNRPCTQPRFSCRQVTRHLENLVYKRPEHIRVRFRFRAIQLGTKANIRSRPYNGIDEG